MIRLHGLMILLAMLAAPASAQIRGVTDTEIVIGTQTDLTGVQGVQGTASTNAYRLVFDAVNEAGGIHGRRIRYIVSDNQYQVPRAIQATRGLIDSDGVFLLVADGGTPMNLAVLDDQLARGVPNLFPMSWARAMYEPYHALKFALFASIYDQMRSAAAYFLTARDRRTPCALTVDSPSGDEALQGLRDQLAAMGTRLAAVSTHESIDVEFAASVAELRRAACDVVFLGTGVRETGLVAGAAHRAGWTVDMVGPVTTYDASIADLPGAITEGYYALTPVPFADPRSTDPAQQDFAERYRLRYSREPIFAAQIGCIGADLLVHALQLAGRDLTQARFIAALESIAGYTDAFHAGPLAFGPHRHQGSRTSFLMQVRGGRWTAVLPAPIGY